MSTPSLHTENDGLVATWRLAGCLSVAGAAEGRALLLEACQHATARELQFDLSGVEDADSATVQLLLATAQHLRQTGKRARVVACSDTLQRLATALGACDERQLCGLDLDTTTATATAGAAA